MTTQQFRTSSGKPLPLGATPCPGGVNFAIHSQGESAFSLCLFDNATQALMMEIPFDPINHRTGTVWHMFVHDLPVNSLYAFRKETCHSLLIDPYAKAVHSSHQWGNPDAYRPLGRIIRDDFDWDGVASPSIPYQDLIIYEMHVRGFTQESSSHVTLPGTFLGMIEKIPYLKSLGVNAVELMPIQEFNENENHHINPNSGERLYNYWGYSPVHFFAPMNRYAVKDAYLEFKLLVKELHRAGIEVILDVVFNHTAEGPPGGPTYSFRGLDEAAYYIHDYKKDYLDFSGCGNTFNANHPIGRQLIIDCLRHWLVNMHVDGFRFDLASVLMRDSFGIYRENAPLIEALTQDPVLAQCKLIAEPWDVGGLYQVGNFYPQIGRWVEWNGKYRDVVRRFISGHGSYLSKFTTRICGSQDLYGKTREPYHSLNFVVAHDGFTLADLVRYNQKHNMENGENNRDGLNQNDSWNCGVEGKTKDAHIIELRQRQMRNFFLTQMISQGIPMILMGDEYGHSKGGNNNSWCQDNATNWFLWDHVTEGKGDTGFIRFYRMMIAFRKSHSLLRRADFLTTSEVIWHGIIPNHPVWSGDNFIALTLIATDYEDIYIAFNLQDKKQSVQIPAPPPHRRWGLIVDTSKESPDDIIDEKTKRPIESLQYIMDSFSAIILVAIPVPGV